MFNELFVQFLFILLYVLLSNLFRYSIYLSNLPHHYFLLLLVLLNQLSFQPSSLLSWFLVPSIMYGFSVVISEVQWAQDLYVIKGENLLLHIVRCNDIMLASSKASVINFLPMCSIQVIFLLYPSFSPHSFWPSYLYSQIALCLHWLMA